MRRDILLGMSLPQKTIPCKYLYDAYGSMLFDEITRLPEYYPTRTEIGILERYGTEIMDFFFKHGGDLVEIGSGSDLKIGKLFRNAPSGSLEGIRYIPMDISETGLMSSAMNLLRDYHWLSIFGIIGDFTRHLDHLPPGRKLITFFGGTFGNFADGPCSELLANLARCMGQQDRLLIGLDMLKPIEIIETAYNDLSGITARFNLNILSHINHQLKADFQQEDFEHLAFFSREKGQIEMHLRAGRRVQAYIGDMSFPVCLDEGETIHTEISRKFSRAGAERLFTQAGFILTNWYTDPDTWFALAELKKAD